MIKFIDFWAKNLVFRNSMPVFLQTVFTEAIPARIVGIKRRIPEGFKIHGFNEKFNFLKLFFIFLFLKLLFNK